MSAAVAHAAPTGAASARPHAAAPAAAGARPRAGGGLRICVPLRLVVGAQYRDAALRTYIKIAALALRPAGCRAKVVTIAGWLGTSASEIERGLRDLQNPDPVDGITEVLTTRKTMRDGTGESAHRTVRPVETDAGELFVWIPVRAADVLRPRLLRLYGAIAYAQARRMPLTVRELADHLRHESGDHQGETLTERQTARLLDELAATGWITVHHRQGPRGRHAYEANPSPLHRCSSRWERPGTASSSPSPTPPISSSRTSSPSSRRPATWPRPRSPISPSSSPG
ncbi:hypothetical protein EAO77_02725 [Streptomyces sp. t39]|nr:hypothetical protein EAO77_02725 [Streptomyces sp. t39]